MYIHYSTSFWVNYSEHTFLKHDKYNNLLLRKSTYIGYAWFAISLDIVFMHLFNNIFELKIELNWNKITWYAL